jgi:hypothetical protein
MLKDKKDILHAMKYTYIHSNFTLITLLFMQNSREADTV